MGLVTPGDGSGLTEPCVETDEDKGAILIMILPQSVMQLAQHSTCHQSVSPQLRDKAARQL